jgi:hypothetical protein
MTNMTAMCVETPVLFTTATKLLLLRKICDGHGLPPEVVALVYPFAFTTREDAMRRVERQHDNVMTIIDSALTRKNGFGGVCVDNSEHEQWFVGCVDYVFRDGSIIDTQIVEMEATNCRKCGNYTYSETFMIRLTHAIHPRLVCSCDDSNEV